MWAAADVAPSHLSRSAASGATLVDLHIEHLHAVGARWMFRKLDTDVVVARAEHAAMAAFIEGRHGYVELWKRAADSTAPAV